MTVSSQLADAVYLASILGLSILLARPIYLVYSASQVTSAQLVASGLQAEIDSMSPGTTLVMTLQSYPGIQLHASLSGSTVSVRFGDGGATATAHVKWALPTTTLLAGETYSFVLEGGKLAIEPARADG